MTQQMLSSENRSFGLVTDEVDLASVAPDQAEGLSRLVATCGVVVFRNQALDDSAFVRLLNLLGPMTFTPGETTLPDQPMLNAVSNVGRATPPRSVFHTDSSYLPAPPAYTALRAVSVPNSGGATLFSDQYAAAERLSPAMRGDLAQRTVQHSVTSVAGHEETYRHPLLRQHPLAGRVALYLSTPERCRDISGLTPERSRRVVDFLYRHSIRPSRLFTHRWAAGDVVIWDDRCTLHKADHSATVGDRVLHRGMVKGNRHGLFTSVLRRHRHAGRDLAATAGCL